MSLQTRLAALISNIGGDIKAHAAELAGVPQEPIPADCGYLAWNQSPLGLNTSTTIATSGIGYAARITNHKSVSIQVSSVTVLCGTGGTGLTNVGFALYSDTGNLLTSSVNTNGATTAAFATPNPRTVTFALPQTIAPGASFYVMFWFTHTSGAVPFLYRNTGTNIVANFGTVAPNFRFCTFANGATLTTTPPATLGTQTMGSSAVFVAVA